MAGQVLVRLPTTLAARVASAAEADGLTAAAWLRALAVAAVGARPEDAAPVRAYRRPAPPPPEHVVEIARLRESVGELAGAMVQAAIASRVAGRGADHAAIEAALPGVRQVARDLDRLKRAMLGDSGGGR
ncbi:hypothetical protein [Azospirillum sp. TSO22-1]|uniref:hypothetical protein n=1 Tax=Azospirillum sp. TSO22-1 TaxID=716789 RepID=UPI000D621BB8|nr:hypothetical protein [Azospirillum sp. TSO22-1]PWC45872.1 hypothetical protein TSO221_15065 [Azospirillum sp. TSO22-1]